MSNSGPDNIGRRRAKRQTPAGGRLHGHPRRGYRLWNPRRHPRELGCGIRFTGAQLGDIGGASFTSFCFGIIVGGIVVDKIGYGKLIVAAFLFHMLSALVTFGATTGQDQATASHVLYIGTFLFGLANGTLEAVANPLVSTLFPENRTHYLEHPSCELAGRPGARRPRRMDPRRRHASELEAAARALSRPDGALRRGVPRSEVPEVGSVSQGSQPRRDAPGSRSARRARGVRPRGPLLQRSTGRSILAFFTGSLVLHFGDVGLSRRGPSRSALLIVVGINTNFSTDPCLLFVLFITHALLGSVELGTDSWIQNITGNILDARARQGPVRLHLAADVLAALLRALYREAPARSRPSACSSSAPVLAVVGLRMVSGIDTFVGAMVALAVYASGKTFFWPTMLAIVGDRFPRTGAVAMSIMGGIGMMSAGLLGGPGLGYAKDRFTAEHLSATAPAIYEQYKAPVPSKFLFLSEVRGLDGTKLSAAQTAAAKTPEQRIVSDASIVGDRETLKAPTRSSRPRWPRSICCSSCISRRDWRLQAVADRRGRVREVVTPLGGPRR